MRKSNRFWFQVSLVIMFAVLTFIQTAAAGTAGKSILVQHGKERTKKSLTFHKGDDPNAPEVSGVRNFHKENPPSAAKTEPTAEHHEQAQQSKTDRGIVKHQHEPSAAAQEEEASNTVGALPAFNQKAPRRVRLSGQRSSALSGK